MNDSMSCPRIGLNSCGIAILDNGKQRPVRIDYIRLGELLDCHDIETGAIHHVHLSQFKMKLHIPSKYREPMFLTVAPYWGEALQRWPSAITIRPLHLAPETLVRKLREARVGKETYKWKTTCIDEVLWANHAKDMVITPLPDGTVQMGPADATGTSPATQPVAAKETEVFVKISDKFALEHFCNLVAQRVFNPKPAFVLTGLDATLIADLETRYDIGFMPRDDGAWDVIF
jgi:hypothetical protein